MAELLRAAAAEELVYCFAAEYVGPPVSYDLPRAVPIEVDCIPTAAVAAALADRLTLPVVPPLVPPPPMTKAAKSAAGSGRGLIAEVVVSPTSVIGFDDGGSVGECNGGDSCSERSIARDAAGKSIACDRLSDASGGFENLESLDDAAANLGVGVSFSDELVHLQELPAGGSAFSGALGSSNGRLGSEFGGSMDFSNDLRVADWDSSESLSSSPLVSSENSFYQGELSCGDLSNEVDGMASTSTPNDAESVGERVESSSGRGKKGSCYRCMKGSRFTEKETCIVCNAKYCCGCVLRAMGSMPEGRKCLACIGSPIDESRRESLGKCSRLLKRLLSPLEFREVIKAEKSCEVNQIQPEYFLVNGRNLSQDEMVLLQTCSNPPCKLKPGRYWYDKVSGLWGKEGQKPSQIISPNLNVGEPILPNSSGGTTKVFINNREITKEELLLLKWSGVQCAGDSHFWLNADGSYQEEGQKTIRGNIWGKLQIRLLCSVLSLPVPSKATKFPVEEASSQLSRAVHEFLEPKILQKLLLVGPRGSGTSTIFKQAKFLYSDVPYSVEERENAKYLIQSNLYKYLAVLLEGRERFEEESIKELKKTPSSDRCIDSGPEAESDIDNSTIYSISPKLKAFSDWLLKVMASGKIEAIFPASTREYAPIVEKLWNDAAIKATYNRRNELQLLPNSASYFLERVVDIAKMEYEPSDLDILHAEGVTPSNGLTYVEFSFPHSEYKDINASSNEDDSFLRYQLVRVHSKGIGENCKWLEMFEDVRIVVFCVAVSDYDTYVNDEDGTSTNKMLLNKKLFESIVLHPSFEQVDFLLLLNKFDILEQKIEQVPLTVCDWFCEFNPVSSRHQNSMRNSNNESSLSEQAFHYIARSFKQHFQCLTGRRLYVSQTNGLSAKSVDEAMRYAREIMKWEEDKSFFTVNENSVFSAEQAEESWMVRHAVGIGRKDVNLGLIFCLAIFFFNMTCPFS